MKAFALLVTTLVVTTLGDGPGHHGHHGDHHGAGHHAEHGADHGAHHAPDAKAAPQHHAVHQPAQHHAPAKHHAAHPQPHHPRPQQQRLVRPQAPRAVRRPVQPLRPRPQAVRRPQRPQASPFNLFGLTQQQKALPHVPRPVRGLHNNLPDRAPARHPHHPQHLIRRPNANVLPGAPTKAPVVTKPVGKSVAALIAENEHFSTLHTALKAAGMMEKLAGSGPFTVFAPTNAAFDKVPVDSLNKLMANKEELIKVLERHIVPGVRMEGKEVPDGNTKLKSASGDEIATDRDNFVKVSTPSGSAFVVKFDFLGNNGVYHAVDQVL